MEVSSPRVKALAVTAGFTFWFFLITSATGYFSLELLAIFLIFVILLTQIFATKIFLGILFVFVISIYGIIFKILRIDVLRLKKQESSYWLNIDKIKQSTSETQF